MQIQIPFNLPCNTGDEKHYIAQALNSDCLSGGGAFTKKCEHFIEKRYNIHKAFLTPSATDALEMCALLLEIQEGDEVIMPSYTFVSTANAFVLRGATIKFIDIHPDDMNLDEDLIEGAITEKTKAIVVVHYGGVACNMDAISALAKRYGLYIIEDAAQGIEAFYNDRPLGAIGDLSVYSFHETKNLTSGGEGGALLINNEKFLQRAEIIREKGTNRHAFFRGEVDKYSWVDIGGSYLMNDLSAAYLYAQLRNIEKITQKRQKLWHMYEKGLQNLQNKGYIELPKIPYYAKHNAHLFYIKTPTIHTRTHLLAYLREYNIYATFHYVPLHSSTAGQKYGNFHGVDTHTTQESEKILRLPMHYALDEQQISHVINTIKRFYDNNH